MLTKVEQSLLNEACRKLPHAIELELEKSYAVNMAAMVLDFQLTQKIACNAHKHFKSRFDSCEHHELRSFAESFADKSDGYALLAKELWGYSYSERAKYLRVLLQQFEQRGVTDQSTLENWVANADFERDVKGKFKSGRLSIGFTMFQYLRLRMGHDTVKPDSRVLDFIKREIGRSVKPVEAVKSLEQAALEVGRRAREIDKAIYG